MGCSQSLILQSTYYDSGELNKQFYVFNDRYCGPMTKYHKNGNKLEIHMYVNDVLYGQFIYFDDNGNVEVLGRHITNSVSEYKQYDFSGSLTRHIIFYHDAVYTKDQHDLRAIYKNNKLCTYYIKRFDPEKLHIIYNTTNVYDITINVSVINAIRRVQKKFRRRKYYPIVCELNSVIEISDVVQLIILYI